MTGETTDPGSYRRADGINGAPVECNAAYSPVTLEAVALHRRDRTPVRLHGKKPSAGPGWQLLRFTSEAEVKAHFTEGIVEGANLGMLLGDGLADVDLDCPEALRTADWLLTPTPRRSGRASAPGSHRWYRIEPGKHGYEKFVDADKETLLELRADSGHQTMVPPSVHPDTGEAVLWECPPDTEARVVALEDLGAEAAALAVVCTLGRGRRWPREGSRHDAYLALAGGLLRGAPQDARLDRLARKIISALAHLTDDEEALVRADEAVPTTWRRLESDEPVTGWTTLGRELLSDDGPVTAEQVARRATRHAAKMRSYLGLPYADRDGNADREVADGRDGDDEEEIEKRARGIRLDRAARQLVDDEEAARREAPDPGILDAWQMFERYRAVAGQHLVQNAIPRQGIVSFFGPSGGGKSSNVIALSLNLAHGPGARWFGRPVLERVATLYVPFEGVHEVHIKAFAQAKALGYGRDELSLLRFYPESSFDGAVGAPDRAVCRGGGQ